MKTLEQIKKNKNWIAYEKGYPQDPEGFSVFFLLKRMKDEIKELDDKLESLTEYQIIFNDSILEELADISNIIDYLSTKITVNYPTIYQWQKQQLGEKQ